MKSEEVIRAKREELVERFRRMIREDTFEGGYGNTTASMASAINYVLSDDPHYTIEDGIDEFRREVGLDKM